jgi:hypothetical protein
MALTAMLYAGEDKLIICLKMTVMRSLRSIYKTLLLSAAILSLCTQVSAQPSADINSAIREMFEHGNEHFIIAMAMQDGLLKEYEAYFVEVKRESVRINGSEVPEPMHARYLAFEKAFHGGRNVDMSMRGGGQTLKDFLNLESPLRRSGGAKVNGLPAFTGCSLIRILEYDSLVAPGARFILTYSRKSLLFNGKPMSPTLDAKYKRILGYDADYWLKNDSDVYTVQR